MAAPSIFQGDMIVQGTLSAGTLTPSNSSVTDAKVSATAAIAASKLCNRNFRRAAPAGTISTSTYSLGHAYAAGTISQFVASCIGVPTSTAAVTVDLKKNGTSVLSSPITLNSSSVTLTQQIATISTPSYVAGDHFQIVFTTSGSGTQATGVVGEGMFDENPS